jgi:hypothetical protein
MSARRNSTLSIRAPRMTGARPRRTVSTSGSSGIAGGLAHEKEAGLTGGAEGMVIALH